MKSKLKYLIILLIISFSQSCKRKIEKPFVIVSKSVIYNMSGKSVCRYSYQDKTGGMSFDFYDESDLYHVGDTIK